MKVIKMLKKAMEGRQNVYINTLFLAVLLTLRTTGVDFTKVYEQLLLTQISKAQKDSQVISVFLSLCDLGSISSTFYVQLLRAQILNAQKDSQVSSVVWQVWDLRVQKLYVER